ncbi:MAG: Fe-S-containing protein [Methylobacteriaceae bacterium]|nr:Fe-S-containing protein [Methylobacteriaceae bacterium]
MLAPANPAVTLGVAGFQMIVLFHATLVQLFPPKHDGLVEHGILIFSAASSLGKNHALVLLTGARVINTDLLLRCAAVLSVSTCLVVSAVLLSRLLRALPGARLPITVFGVVTAAVPLVGAFALALTRLGYLETTKTLVSVIAVTTNSQARLAYLGSLVTGVLIALFVAKVLIPRRRAWRASGELISRRIAEADYRGALLTALFLPAATLVPTGVSLYWDIVASRPPSLSTAVRVESGTDRAVHLGLAPLMDGNLHRFVWFTDTGRPVRFFVVNRFSKTDAPGVVFDACLLCGDKGYIQENDQIVCVGCKVRLYKPSIGKHGGCNPVPVEDWRLEGNAIVIPEESLMAGVQLFRSETVAATGAISAAGGQHMAERAP